MESTPNTIQPHRGEGAPEPHVDNRPEPNTTTQPGIKGTTNENLKPLSLVGTPQVVADMNMGILFSEDVDGMKDKVFVIDAYIKNQMAERDLDATVGNYREILAGIKDELNIDEGAGSMTQASLLYYYLKGKLNV